MIGQLGLRVNLIAYPVVSVKKVAHFVFAMAVLCTLCVQEGQVSPLLVCLENLKLWTSSLPFHALVLT